MVLIRLHHFSHPSPSMAYLIYSRIASSTPHRLQAYWVDLNPLSDWFSSNPPPDWHIYILYSGIPYTCVIYLYTTSLHFTATPSAFAPRGIYLRITPVGTVTPNSPLRVLHSSLSGPWSLAVFAFRISCFARLYIREIWQWCFGYCYHCYHLRSPSGVVVGRSPGLCRNCIH